MNYRKLISKCTHQILNKSFVIVSRSIVVNYWHQVVVDVVIASQSYHINSILEKLFSCSVAKFGPYQFLCSLKQLDLFVEANSLDLNFVIVQYILV